MYNVTFKECECNTHGTVDGTTECDTLLGQCKYVDCSSVKNLASFQISMKYNFSDVKKMLEDANVTNVWPAIMLFLIVLRAVAICRVHCRKFAIKPRLNVSARYVNLLCVSTRFPIQLSF